MDGNGPVNIPLIGAFRLDATANPSYASGTFGSCLVSHMIVTECGLLSFTFITLILAVGGSLDKHMMRGHTLVPSVSAQIRFQRQLAR